MSNELYNKSEETLKDILEMISSFETHRFSKSIADTDDPKLKPIVERLNQVAKKLDEQAQQKFLDDRGFLEPVLAALPGLVSYMDHNLRYLYVNDAYEKWFGVPKEKCLNSNMFDVVGQAAVQSVQSQLNAAYSGIPQDFNCDVHYTFGGFKSVHVQYFPDITADGRVRGVIALVNDRTIENSALNDKKFADLENSTILEMMTDGFVLQDKNGTIEKFNPAALQLLGLTEDQLLGRTSLDPRWQAIREDGSDFPGDQHPVMQALKTGQPVRGVLMGLPSTNGNKTWIKINAVPFESNSGRRIACTFSDVTELINAQREIRFILDSLKIGVWKFNPVTNELIWDQSMYKVFERSESDFSGHYQAWESTLTPESKAQAIEDLRLALQGEKDFDTVFEIETKSRGKRFISGQGTVIRDQSKNPIMMIGLNADVTDQIKIKKDLELERLKSLRNAKLASLGEMSAGIAHEINNPLAIISLNVGLLGKYSSEPEKFDKKIEIIEKSCERIARIVMGLRKFSRSGDRSNFQVHKLPEIVREAISLLEVKSKRYETPVTVECDQDIRIFCDEIEIEQVIVNLITNAIDAVKESPEKWVKVTIVAQGKEVLLRIEDSGHGIPEKIRNKLFEPFFTTKKTGEGTGLGLSIAKGILDEHKASIHVVGESPHTCFEIRFLAAETKTHVA